MLEAFGVTRGDDVITSVGAALGVLTAIERLGARPVLEDVHPRTLLLDERRLERRLTTRTRAIMPVHFAGLPCAMDEILAIAARRDVAVVEEATHALPAGYRGRKVGSIGDAAVFALGPAPAALPGRGAVMTTDRADCVAWWKRGGAGGCGRVRTATRLDADAFARADRAHGIRSYYARLYQLGLSDLPELVLPEGPPWGQHGWAFYVVRVEAERLRGGRDAVVERLHRLRVRATVPFVPLYADARVRRTLGLRGEDFPAAREAAERTLALPLDAGMVEAEVWRVIDAVRRVIAEHRPGGGPR